MFDCMFAYHLLIRQKKKRAFTISEALTLAMAVSISNLMSFFLDDRKTIDRGENHYKSGHVEQCSLDAGLLTGIVRASMRDKVYRVSVSKTRER